MKIYVGAGEDASEWSSRGWICNDVLAWPSVTLVGSCWNLPVPDRSVDEILAKGMLEHLTYCEVERAFAEWRRVLCVGGFVTIEVPDIIEYIEQYLLMRGAPETIQGEGEGIDPREPEDDAACSGIDRWLRRALFGWQRFSGDEHRSGWTEPLLAFYLAREWPRYEIRRMAISFDEDVSASRTRHLWARAWKEQS